MVRRHQDTVGQSNFGGKYRQARRHVLTPTTIGSAPATSEAGLPQAGVLKDPKMADETTPSPAMEEEHSALMEEERRMEKGEQGPKGGCRQCW